tara:strand:+ start:65 stop:2314 length:2250 start_codon:yes stop_codon:yes gene_type:complete
MLTQTGERIDLERAKRLISIDNPILFGHIDVNPEVDGLKKETDEKYCLEIKRLCNKHLKKSGQPVISKYTFSSNMIDNGRLYCNEFSMQRMNSKVRGYLCDKYYYDIDMVNAQPSCLYYILKTFYPQRKWTYIGLYIKQREHVLSKISEDRSKSKTMVITAMNSDKPISPSSNEFFKKLDQEFKMAQQYIWETDCEFTEDLVKYKALSKQNKMGKYLNKVLCCFENMVLQNAIRNFEEKYISTLIMDGFHISKDIEMSINDILTICNDSSDDYGIKWAHKPFSTELDFLDDVELNETNNTCYDSVKKKFEETHFMIMNPLIFGYEYQYDGRATYALYNKQDFSIIANEFQFTDIDSKGQNCKKDLFPEWVKDKSKRSYKQLDFSPVNASNSEFYNTFQGFDCDVLPHLHKHSDEAVELFKQHISHLTDHEPDSVNYFISYLADMIQNPDQPPGIAILLKSPQGHGKDITIDIIGKIINEKYICRTEDIKDVLGNFNTPIKDKVMCVLNELEGKDGWEYRDKLKGLITTKTLNINEKGIKHYKQKNSLRIFVFSNRMNPIEISQDDRRFVVFKSNYRKPKSQYFDRLGDIINNKTELYSIYNYLKNFNITINLKTDRPTTKAYDDMRESNISPLYRFINEIFVNNNIDEYFDKSQHEYSDHKSSGAVLIQSQKLYESYGDYLVYNQMDYIKPNFKNMKQLLNNINVYSKKYKLRGNMVLCYSFNKETICDVLEPMDIQDDFIELNEDEWD